MIEKKFKMDFWFIDFMFCIIIQRKNKYLTKKYVKIRKTLVKIN